MPLVMAACGEGTAPPPEAPVAPAGSPATSPAAPASGAYVPGPVTAGGRIAGRVVYAGAAPPARPVAVTKDHAVCGRTAHVAEGLLVGDGGGLINAVVSIDGIAAGKPFGAARTVLDQRGCWFVPHVLVVPAGAPLDILNSDGILHNIHTFPRNNPAINMAQPRFKKVMTHTFERPDLVRVACDVHGWMGAWIVVAGHPYHAVTDAGGRFALDEVPPGRWTIRVWHETLGERTLETPVETGQAVEMTVTYPGRG
ncbi:MAG: carboxypeptidase regulatory-like domain-containing protein [Candidatus Polarisedimenticolia bacterium]